MDVEEGSSTHQHRTGLVVAGGHHQRAKVRVFFYFLLSLPDWAGPGQYKKSLLR
jgi:hypothetical protein